MGTYNCTPHASTGFSPHFALLGTEPRLPVDVLLGMPDPETIYGVQDCSSIHRRRLREAHNRARAMLNRRAAERQAADAD